MLRTPGDAGADDVVIDNDGLIHVTLHSHQDLDKIKQSGERGAKAIEARHEAGKKALLLLDISRLSSESSSAERLEGRRQFAGIRADAIALVGASQALNVTLYLARLA